MEFVVHTFSIELLSDEQEAVAREIVESQGGFLRIEKLGRICELRTATIAICGGALPKVRAALEEMTAQKIEAPAEPPSGCENCG